MITVEAELLKIRATKRTYFVAKVYVPVEGYDSMDKFYYSGNTKTEAKRKAKIGMKIKNFGVKFLS